MKTNKISNIIDKCESLAAKGKVNVALSQVRKAIQKYKNDPELLGTGAVFASMLDKDKLAQYYFDQALKMSKSNPAIYSNYGAFLRKIERFDDSEIAYKKALDIKPESPTILTNMGNLYQKIGRSEEAEKCYKKSLVLEPNSIDTLFYYGQLLCDPFRDFDNATKIFKKVLELKNNHEKARFHLSLLFLRLAQYKEGWKLYESRYKIENLKNNFIPPSENIHKLSISKWRGESLDNKSILIWPEQGYGDFLQFCRYLYLIKEKYPYSKLLVACKKPLYKVVTNMRCVDKAIFTEEFNKKGLKNIDYWSYILSLPLCFNTEIDTIPNSIPYLYPENIIDKPILGFIDDKRFNIGLVWKGNKKHSNDKNRSLSSISVLSSLWSVNNTNFISLQKGNGEDELKKFKLPVQIAGNYIKDFQDSINIVSKLDLVICVDTAIAHVAGSVNTFCWVLLPYESDWRWLLDRNDSPWYPSIRLFRQAKSESWKCVIDRVKQALEEFIKIKKLKASF